MAELKIHDEAAPAPAGQAAETPAQQLVRKAMEAERLPVEDGRALIVRKPSPLAQFRLVEAAGPEAAANSAYMQMINPLLYLGGIDDGKGEGEQSVPLPSSKREIEALIVRLGDEGLAALMAWYMANVLGPTMDAIKAAEKAAEDAAAIKN